jgi:hypothetical protein
MKLCTWRQLQISAAALRYASGVDGVVQALPLGSTGMMLYDSSVAGPRTHWTGNHMFWFQPQASRVNANRELAFSDSVMPCVAARCRALDGSCAVTGDRQACGGNR